MNRIFIAFVSMITILPVMATGKTSRETKSFTVMSYNIRYGTASDGDNSWENRRHATISMLEDHAPDILGVQEAFSFQISYMLDNLKEYGCVGASRLGEETDAEHPAVFYNKNKIKLIEWGNFWLSGTPDRPSLGWDAACERNVTWLLVRDRKSGKKFFFVNTHLDHVGKEARKAGLEMILTNIGQMNPEQLPVVLTGDFNMDASDPAMKALDGRMSDARKAAEATDCLNTYNGWGNGRTAIDFIFFSGFRHCKEYRTIQDKYDGIKYISDHYPIKAILSF